MTDELKRYLKLNLQHFAEGEGDDAGDDKVDSKTDDAGGDDDDKDKADKKYTDEDVDRIIDKKFAKFKRELDEKEKEKEKAVEEAKKLEKMNAEQKREYELEQERKRADELQARLNFFEMSREASKELAGHDIQADDELLELVVADTAEDTKANIQSFVSLVNKKVEEGVKQALSGKSPKRTADEPQVMTAEDFEKLTYMQKVEFKRKHPERYKKLMNE